MNAVDINEVMQKQPELEAAIDAVIAAKDLGLFLFVVTDIINNDSVILALGQEANRACAAFNVSPVNNTATLQGVVSRKKQIVPPLEAAFNA